MLFPIKVICNPKKKRRDGTSLIYFQYCYSSDNRTLLNSKIAIPAKYWHKKKNCIISSLPTPYGDYAHLNSELTRMQRCIEDLIVLAQNKQIENIGAYVKHTFTPDLALNDIEKSTLTQSFHYPTRQPELFNELDDYIKSKQRKVTIGALSTYRSMKAHLEAFQEHRCKKITFKSFDYSFYEEFVDFLTYDYKLPRFKEPIYGLKTNTVGKTLKQLRIFIADRVKRKRIQQIDLSDYKIPNEEVDAVYLTYSEIQSIYNTSLHQNTRLHPFRDLFVLACLTGLRYSDFSSIHPEDLRGSMLHKKQKKSDSWVVIPLRKEAKELFTKLFSGDIPYFANPEFNRHIKTIGKLSGIDQPITFTQKKGVNETSITRPKYEWLTTHTARRSFCTNEFLAGTPVKLIMQISGHKNEKDFYRYIKITPIEAARKMEEIWLERNNMQALAM